MKTCDHCGINCARRVACMVGGKVKMVGMGCAKKFKRANRSDLFNAVYEGDPTHSYLDPDVGMIQVTVEGVKRLNDSQKERLYRSLKKSEEKVAENYINRMTGGPQAEWEPDDPEYWRNLHKKYYAARVMLARILGIGSATFYGLTPGTCSVPGIPPRPRRGS